MKYETRFCYVKTFEILSHMRHASFDVKLHNSIAYPTVAKGRKGTVAVDWLGAPVT